MRVKINSIIIAAAMLLVAGTVNAQNYINAGYGRAADRITFGNMEPENESFNTVFAGFSHNFVFGKTFGLEAGINFVHGFNNDRDELPGLKSNLHFSSYAFNAPILLNCGIPVSDFLNLKLLVGPTLHYGLSCKTDSIVNGEKAYTIDYYGENSYNRFYVSAGAALAAELSNKFRLKIGYDFGLTDIDHAEKVSLKENLLSFTVSYIF